MVFISACRCVEMLLERVRLWVQCNWNPGCMLFRQTPHPDLIKTHTFWRAAQKALYRWHCLCQCWIKAQYHLCHGFYVVLVCEGLSKPSGRIFVSLEVRSLKCTRGNIELIEEKSRRNHRNIMAMAAKNHGCIGNITFLFVLPVFFHCQAFFFLFPPMLSPVSPLPSTDFTSSKNDTFCHAVDISTGKVSRTGGSCSVERGISSLCMRGNLCFYETVLSFNLPKPFTTLQFAPAVEGKIKGAGSYCHFG